jgi:hypothetical protein
MLHTARRHLVVRRDDDARASPAMRVVRMTYPSGAEPSKLRSTKWERADERRRARRADRRSRRPSDADSHGGRPAPPRSPVSPVTSSSRAPRRAVGLSPPTTICARRGTVLRQQRRLGHARGVPQPAGRSHPRRARCRRASASNRAREEEHASHRVMRGVRPSSGSASACSARSASSRGAADRGS